LLVIGGGLLSLLIFVITSSGLLTFLRVIIIHTLQQLGEYPQRVWVPITHGSKLGTEAVVLLVRLLRAVFLSGEGA
jgi:hypothetical protein